MGSGGLRSGVVIRQDPAGEHHLARARVDLDGQICYRARRNAFQVDCPGGGRIYRCSARRAGLDGMRRLYGGIVK